MRHPTASCGVSRLLRQRQSRGGFFLLLLIFYVMPYHLRCELVAYSSKRVPINPQFTCPELLSEMWKPFKYSPCRRGLRNLHKLSRRISRRCSQKRVHTVLHYLHCVHPEPIFIRYSLKHFSTVLSNLSYQDALPLVTYPDQMVPKIKDGMLSSNPYAGALHEKALFRRTPLLCLATSHFPAVGKVAGIQGGVL